MSAEIIVTAAAVKKIDIRITLISPWGGTSDPLYLGIITKFGGREFPLRYNSSGITLADGETYMFGINSTSLSEQQQIYGSQDNAPNHIKAYPLHNVQRVYLRKEPRNESSTNDDALGVDSFAAFLTHEDDQVVDWSNRNLPDSSGPSPFWLGNEYGQIVYFTPEAAS